ncbi:hypothetical protein BDQ12DRAFT_705008 [Crucibulum laeve]|uniref:Uncharacterized protein n=1 Tax=Crucibulum laeve TaxID=68775 RepID=A0A5C3M553_9AGAR|nr:hypothetical protein BDQ12DRAFT_705008 [Crucibulum laeve]
MRSFLSFSLVATLLTSAGLGALAVPVDECAGMEYCASNFPTDVLVERSSLPSPTVKTARHAWTNAERLVRGLPLKPPTRRDSARRSGPSALPQVEKRGIIEITNTDNGQVIGYVSKNSFSKAQLRYQPAITDAVTVTFSANTGATSLTDARITLVDSDVGAGYPLLGLIQGRDDTNANIASRSFHYLYFGAVAVPGTAPNTPGAAVSNSYTGVTGSQRVAESDVWNIDLTTGSITPQWTNTDGSQPATDLFSQGTALYAGGDSAAFLSRYPSPLTHYTLKFIETTAP